MLCPNQALYNLRVMYKLKPFVCLFQFTTFIMLPSIYLPTSSLTAIFNKGASLASFAQLLLRGFFIGH